jgi:hypothetical protein
MTDDAYADDLEQLVGEWSQRAERVAALIGTAIPATRVPAVVVDYR